MAGVIYMSFIEYCVQWFIEQIIKKSAHVCIIETTIYCMTSRLTWRYTNIVSDRRYHV